MKVWKKCENVFRQMTSQMLPVETNWVRRIWEFPDFFYGAKELYPGAFKIHGIDNVLIRNLSLTLKGNDED